MAEEIIHVDPTLKTGAFRLVEVIVPAAISIGTPIYFKQDNELDGHLFDGLITYDSTILKTGMSGNTVATLLQGAEVLVFLSWKGENRMNGIPFNDLNPVQNKGIIREFKNMPIDLQKSFVQIQSIGAIVAGVSLPFGFCYRRSQPKLNPKKRTLTQGR